MFFRGSRYEHVPDAELTTAEGRVIRHKRRRFIPAVRPALAYLVKEGDRPDLASYAAIGDPELFWRLCDANRVQRPADLTAVPGRRIGVPGPEGELTLAILPSYFMVQVAFAPLPLPFMQALREIEVETSVGQASAFRLHFDLSRNAFGDFDALAIDIFRPLLPITIRVSLGLGLPQALINGYIKDVRLGASNDPGRSTLEVSGMDALGTTMAHIDQPFTWPNSPDGVVAAAIFGKYGIIPTVIPTPPTRTMLDTTTTQRVNDSAYLQQLAARNSYELYIQPDPVVGRDMGHFHPPLSFAPPQGVLSIDFGTQTNLTGFNVSYDSLAPTSVIAVSIDPRTRVPIPAVAPVSLDIPMGLEPTLNRILPPPIERPEDTDAANPAEVQMQAFTRATTSSRSIQGSGEVDGMKYNRPLLVGLPVLVRGAGRQHSGLYYLTSVTHRISRDSYTQSFSGWRNAVGLTGAEIFIDPLSAVA